MVCSVAHFVLIKLQEYQQEQQEKRVLGLFSEKEADPTEAKFY